MWRRGRNGANPGMVLPWNKGSGIRSRTYGRDVLNGGSGKSRHDGSGCCKSGSGSSGGGRRARVGAAGRGRRRLPHSRLEAVSSALNHHGWVGEGEDIERMGGRKVSEMNWNEKERRGGGGGGGGGGVAKELSPINIHKYG